MTPTVWLSQAAFHEIVAEAEDKSPNETGGVLLGYWSSLWEEAVIVGAIGPGPGAIHGRYEFRPDGEYHWQEIEDEFVATGGRHTYLGDWHSHPAGGACLSKMDRSTLKKIARDPASQAPRPLMLVLTGGDIWHPLVWRWDPRIWVGYNFGWDGTPAEVKIFV